MAELAFIKMHGLGNDFVVLDGRTAPIDLPTEAWRRISDRRLGVGCDQFLILEPPANGRAEVFLRIRNADGGEAEACGNGTRCIARLVMAETGREEIAIETVAGILQATAASGDRVAVDMGPARTAWAEIPLAEARDTLHLGLALGPLHDPVATSLGNPHATFFVEDAEAVDLSTLGPQLERDPLFPERANIGVAQVLGPERLRFRVWERGVGITRACGSGACAAVVAAARRGLTGRRAAVVLDGGELEIDWREDGHVLMTGPTTTAFSGTLGAELLGP
ncbi:MAG: diaminopimelate epimerase [Kiloniellales bacterium]|nr:diaminopimelate epimerase [Kiloniellales bacterium]